MVTKASFQDVVTDGEARNQKLAFDAAVEGIVLLENDGTLPISTGKLALFGAGAAYTIQGGSGSGEVTSRHTVNILEGLEEAGFTITTKDWIARYDEQWRSGKESFLKSNQKKLLQFSTKVLADLMAAEYRYPSGDQISKEEIRKSETDTCVYVLSRQSGEGHDRRDEPGSFRLTDTEIINIQLCAEKYEKFILVLNTGAPIDITPLDEIQGINALVYMNQLGMEGGRALAAILTGKSTPSGKLAVSWPMRYSDYPFSNEFGPYAKDEMHAEYKEGIYVGYRYFDSFEIKPRYPFGFGRSYSKFLTRTRNLSLEGSNVHIETEVTNSGGFFSGKEVVEVYVSCPQTDRDQEYQRLVAFCKTKLLAPGETEVLRLDFPLEALSTFCEETAETLLESGNYIILVGNSSRNTVPAGKLSLSDPVIISRHKNLCSANHSISQLSSHHVRQAELKDLPEVTIPTNVLGSKVYDYSGTQETFSERTEEILNRFAPEDMVKFCAGTGLFGENKGFKVPGSVGHTTIDYMDQGIPNRELCDGPAGLRIQRRSTIDKKGKIKAVDTSISLYEFLPGFVRKLLLGNLEKEQLIYQYVTGFPVAAAVAQSWNLDLAEQLGRAVSTEMTEYGVTWWLAPALNIVRNPLCGRNYEYYSEDPVISGKFAAAVTRGVQETPGNYVTIKHFAANNQEENRYYVSSDLDERTLREIYLKGFEIAVKEAAPKAVMSAYNKLNGTYCANNRGLCTDILRAEWGFRGLVMTDWLSTGEDRADEAACLNSGVDLIMPGGKKTGKKLIQAFENGAVSKEVLRTSCGRVLEQVLE